MFSKLAAAAPRRNTLTAALDGRSSRTEEAGVKQPKDDTPTRLEEYEAVEISPSGTWAR
jgi:hypothetical protein